MLAYRIDMAEVKPRSYAVGALAAIGLTAAGIAAMWNSPEQSKSVVGAAADEFAAAQSSAEQTMIDNLTTPPPDGAPQDAPLSDRRRMAMSGSASEIQQARRDDRVGSFRTVVPSPGTPVAGRLIPKMGVAGLSPGDGAASETGPIEFIVKLDDRKLSDDLRSLYQKAPDQAAARLKTALGNGKLLQGARLQGFTLGGEAILRWNGPDKIADFGAAQDEIQRVLSAAPGVSYAEQNYTADINSAQ